MLLGHNNPPTDWEPANNGAGARIWFVYRSIGGQMEVASDRRGNYRRFATHKAALRAASELRRGHD